VVDFVVTEVVVGVIGVVGAVVVVVVVVTNAFRRCMFC
jgi:hypothetical protein